MLTIVGLVKINSDEIFYLFTVSVIKCGGSCSAINDLYASVSLLKR